MPLFSRNRAPALVVDDLLGNPRAHAAMEAARSADVAAVRAALEGTTGEERSLVVEGVSRGLPLAAAVEWSAAEPDSADVWLLRAATEGWQASEARGSDKAETLTTAQALDFGQLMADSRRSAERAADLDRADPEPVLMLIRTAYALGPADLRDHLHELRRRDPWHLFGLSTTVDVLGEKWYGEAGEARELADGLAAEAPDGSLVPMLVAHAVREQWLYLTAFQKNRAAAIGFVTSPGTKEALEAARAKSVDSPAHRPSPMTPLARSVFAFTYYVAGNHKAAVDQLAASDGVAPEFPWGMLGDAATVVEKARRGR